MQHLGGRKSPLLLIRSPTPPHLAVFASPSRDEPPIIDTIRPEQFLSPRQTAMVRSSQIGDHCNDGDEPYKSRPPFRGGWIASVPTKTPPNSKTHNAFAGSPLKC